MRGQKARRVQQFQRTVLVARAVEPVSRSQVPRSRARCAIAIWPCRGNASRRTQIVESSRRGRNCRKPHPDGLQHAHISTSEAGCGRLRSQDCWRVLLCDRQDYAEQRGLIPSIQMAGERSEPVRVPKSQVARQATDALEGYVYQLHQTVLAWLTLGPNELLHIEFAEDFAVSDDGELALTQVKRTAANTTLRSEGVTKLIASVWEFQAQNPSRRVSGALLSVWSESC